MIEWLPSSFPKLQPDKWIETESICSYFDNLTEFDVAQIVTLLKNEGYIEAVLDDNSVGVVLLLHKGKVYFETKNAELKRQQPSVIINNSRDFNVGNNNTINVTNGITAGEATRLIEQSSLNDKEALQEVISLLNDALENNKPIQPSKFKKALSCITSIAPLLNLIGGIVFSKMTGQS